MSDVIDVDDRTWEDLVERQGKPALAMFHSPTCPHCQMMMPYFEEYASEFRGKVAFVRLNVLENIYTAQRYGIMGTPTFKFFCGGRPVQELVGAVYPTLLKKLAEDGLSLGDECKRASTPIDYDIGYA